MLHPWLLETLKDVRGTGQTYVLLGVVIVWVQLLELPGIWLKKPLVSERIRQRPNDKYIAVLAKEVVVFNFTLKMQTPGHSIKLDAFRLKI